LFWFADRLPDFRAIWNQKRFADDRAAAQAAVGDGGMFDELA